ncbi:MAG: Asp-tRNA(Asn)/Glu-tRNA(Gln) amidotransferase subunit GatC [Pseudomonadota bacterium]
MSLDTAVVAKAARLARLEMDEGRLDYFAGQLTRILGFIDTLSAVNTDDVLPLANVSDITLSLRADTVTEGNQAANILANAPESAENFFVVPKVVE